MSLLRPRQTILDSVPNTAPFNNHLGSGRYWPRRTRKRVGTTVVLRPRQQSREQCTPLPPSAVAGPAEMAVQLLLADLVLHGQGVPGRA